jgi:alkylhydroperoxidase family enzyme
MVLDFLGIIVLQFERHEVRRLGLSERGILEIIPVIQIFSCYNKIAEGLQLEPDFPQC